MGKGSSGHKGNNSSKKNRAIYKVEGRYLRNKIKRLKRWIKNNPNDLTALKALTKALKEV